MPLSASAAYYISAGTPNWNGKDFQLNNQGLRLGFTARLCENYWSETLGCDWTNTSFCPWCCKNTISRSNWPSIKAAMVTGLDADLSWTASHFTSSVEEKKQTLSRRSPWADELRDRGRAAVLMAPCDSATSLQPISWQQNRKVTLWEMEKCRYSWAEWRWSSHREQPPKIIILLTKKKKNNSNFC